MRILRSVVRWAFACEAFLFFAIGVDMYWTRQPPSKMAGPLTPEFSSLVGVCLVAMAMLSGMTAWWVRRPYGYRRAGGILASAMNLPLFPFGTALAGCGLFYFIRRPLPDPVEPKHVPVPGDGTGKWSRVAFYAVEIAWVWMVYGRARTWAMEHGLHISATGAVGWAALFAAIYVAVALHECGHFAAGRAVGFRLTGFRLGPLGGSIRSGQWRIRFETNNVFGGHVAMVPESPESIRKRAMILTLGGPLGSGVCAVAAGVSLWLAQPDWPAWVVYMLVLLTSMGSGDFILNLIPVPSGSSYSDGARLWQLAKDGAWAEYLCSIYYMGLSQTTALRPRDWPAEMIERSADFAVRLPDAANTLALAYVHFEDRRELGRAARYLDLALRNARPGSKFDQSLATERAYFEAFHNRDAQAGARWLASVPEKLDSSDYLRAKAAVLGAAGDLAGAEVAWNRGWQIVSRLPAVGLYEVDRDKFRAIAERLKEIPAGVGTLAGAASERG